VWEVAWAVGDGPVKSGKLPHSVEWADPDALEINRYSERMEDMPFVASDELWAVLRGNTICGMNPAFDARFLSMFFMQMEFDSPEPWHHRLLDIEAYAMGALGYSIPQGFRTIAAELRERGYTISEPDHTAAGDVKATREVHKALMEEYKLLRVSQPTSK
jgi:DNA polymerase-3 subunit epsilon